MVSAVERVRERDGTVRLLALHGANAGRPWRLTMQDALAAFGTGRYVFEVEHEGGRRRAELVDAAGTPRLGAPSPTHGDLIEALPDWGDPAQGAGPHRDTREAAVTSDTAS
jgi:hypothetical protein